MSCSLSPALDRFSVTLQTRCVRVYKAVRVMTGLSHDDYTQMARGVAFLTIAKYYDVGTLRLDDPDTATLLLDRHLQEGCRALTQELSGRGSEFYDCARRQAGSRTTGRGYRNDVRADVCERWSAHRQPTPDETTDTEAPWLDDLRAALRERLPSKDVALLEECYLAETPRQVLAERLAASSPAYRDAKGLQRAMTAINTRLCRVRKAARAVLGPRFADIAQAVVA